MAEPTVKFAFSLSPESDPGFFKVAPNGMEIRLGAESSFLFHHIFTSEPGYDNHHLKCCEHGLNRLFLGHSLVYLIYSPLQSSAFQLAAFGSVLERVFLKAKRHVHQTQVFLSVSAVNETEVTAAVAPEEAVSSLEEIEAVIQKVKGEATHLAYMFKVEVNDSGLVRTGYFPIVELPISPKGTCTEDFSKLLLSAQLEQTFKRPLGPLGTFLQSFIQLGSSFVFRVEGVLTSTRTAATIKCIELALKGVGLHNVPRVPFPDKITVSQKATVQEAEEDIRSMAKRLEKQQYLHTLKLYKLSEAFEIRCLEIQDPEFVKISKEYRDALPKQTVLLEKHAKLRHKLEELEKELNSTSMQAQFSKKSRIDEMQEMVQAVNSAKAEIKGVNKNHSEEEEEATKLHQLVVQSHHVLEQKAEKVYNYPFMMKCKAADIKNKASEQQAGADEARALFLSQIKEKELATAQHIDALIKDFEQKLLEKDEAAATCQLSFSEHLREQQ